VLGARVVVAGARAKDKGLECVAEMSTCPRKARHVDVAHVGSAPTERGANC